MRNIEIVLTCLNGFTLRTRGGNLIIESRKGEEIVPISKIQSFTIKEPGAFSAGRITFHTAQAASGNINWGFGVSTATGAEKTFMFSGSMEFTAKKLKEYVTEYEEPQQQSPIPSATGASVSVAEELRSLKSLLDEGILTKEEFEAKKKQLLNL